MTLSTIPKPLRARIERRDAGRCQYCHLLQFGQGSIFHIDHIVPKSLNGATAENNLALQCPSCSLRKSNKIASPDPLTGQTTTLFHPLKHTWTEHFSINPRGVCNGLTPIGRATVQALAMNDDLPRIARSIQIELGLLLPSQ